MTARYLIKLEPDDNDTLLVTCPALPEVTTFGEDEADALRHAGSNAIASAATHSVPAEGAPRRAYGARWRQSMREDNEDSLSLSRPHDAQRAGGITKRISIPIASW